jgi:hypothetical protein
MTKTVESRDVKVRKVSVRAWSRLRIFAARAGLSMGEALNQIIAAAKMPR